MSENGEEQQPSHRALLLDTDLFFAVKIADTLKHVGYTTRTVRRAEAFAAALASDSPEIALVNTAMPASAWRDALHAARAAGVATVAYGSHVDVETQQQARDDGATTVIANSKLAQDLPGVVARALRRNVAANSEPVADDGPDNEKSP